MRESALAPGFEAHRHISAGSPASCPATFMKFFGLLGALFLVPTAVFGMMFLIHYLRVGYFSGYLFAGLIAAFCLLIAVLMFSFGVAMESMS